MASLGLHRDLVVREFGIACEGTRDPLLDRLRRGVRRRDRDQIINGRDAGDLERIIHCRLALIGPFHTATEGDMTMVHFYADLLVRYLVIEQEGILDRVFDFAIAAYKRRRIDHEQVLYETDSTDAPRRPSRLLL